MQQLKAILQHLQTFVLRYYLLFFLAFAAYRAANIHVRFFNGIIWSDTEGYYLYLPALFIHGGFEELPVRTEAQFPIMEGTNKRFTKYTSGVAMLQAPFFLAAHFAARANDQKLDGYSPYYVYGVQIAALLYGFLGLLVLQRTLLRHFTSWMVFFTITGLLFGTNLFHYVVQEPGMSHVYSFFLFSLFLYFTPRFYQKPGLGIFFGMGLLLGLITLIRPTNLIVLLYLLLYGIRSTEDFKTRIAFIQQHFLKLLIAPLGSLLIFLPQFYYWHYMSGHWLMYSYGDEGFIYWNEPQFINVLFSIKNGWFIFSPIVGLPILGCLIGSWKNRYNIGTIFLILLISIYVFSSWWCWWFGGAFGHRSFVELYTLLAFPFAYLFTLVFESRFLLLKLLLVLVWLGLIYYSYMFTVYFTGPHYNWTEWYQVWEWAKDFRFDIEQ